jgi:predicted permease
VRNPPLLLGGPLVLGIAMSAAGTAFGIVNGVFLKTDVVPGLSSLVVISHPGRSAIAEGVSFPDFERLKAMNAAPFAAMTASMRWRGTLSSAGRSEAVSGEIVSSDYFSTLQVRPILGTLAHTGTGGAGVYGVTISHRLWTAWYGQDPAVVGAQARLNGRPVTIIAVAPDGFKGIFAPTISRADVWIPVEALSSLEPSLIPLFASSRAQSVRAMARLAEPHTLRDAESWAAGLGNFLQPPNATSTNLRAVQVSPGRDALIPFDEVGIALGVAFVMLTAVVVSIACMNLSNLFLASCALREPEFAARLSLGASRADLARMLVLESSLLAFGACVVATLISAVLGWALTNASLPHFDNLSLNATMDLRVVLFVALLAAGCTLAVGLAAAWRLGRLVPLQVLMSAGRSGSSPGNNRFRKGLVAGQISLCVLLLFVAGLYLRGAIDAIRHDSGVDTAGLSVARVDLSKHAYDETAGRRFVDQVRNRARLLGGVTNAAVTSGLPIEGGNAVVQLAVGATTAGARMSVADPGLLRMAGIELLIGRDFDTRDSSTSTPVAIVNQSLASFFWTNESPIGRRLQLGPDSKDQVEIVGVIEDTDIGRPGRGRGERFLLLPLTQRFSPRIAILVATVKPAAQKGRELSEVIRSVDPDLAVEDAGSLDAKLAAYSAPTYIASIVFGIVSSAGLAVALLGLYSVLAFDVGSRRKEIGLRSALGATPFHILWLVEREALKMVLTGLVFGSLLTYLATMLMENMALGTARVDSVAIAMAMGVTLGSAVFASAWPARAALTIEPTVAMRDL